MLSHKWLGVWSGISILSAVPVLAAVSNGFDSSNIYALRNTDRVLITHDKFTQITTSSNWANKGVTGGAAIDGVFKAPSTSLNSLGFSWSTTPGANTPAGSRLFYVGADNLNYPILQEVDSSQNIIREAYIGRIVNGNADFGGATVTIAGNVRYNALHNTLMIPVSQNGLGTGGTAHLYVYEITLPDSPVGTGVNGVNETQGAHVYHVYDTGATGTNAVDARVDVAPGGTIYVKAQTTDVLSFNTNGVIDDGLTTGGAVTEVTNTTLNTTTVFQGQWQSAIFSPFNSGSLVNLQRKTTANNQGMALWDLAGPLSDPAGPASLIAGSSGYRGQNGAIRDDNTDADAGNIFVASVSTTGAPGGVWRYSAAGVLGQWDTNTSTSEFDVAIPVAVPEPATLVLLGLGVAGLIRRRRPA